MRLEDYGFIGDTETGALVGKNGSIDWLCLPRFDAAACFAKLLGTEEHGFWKIAPKAEEIQVTRHYEDHTLVLCTVFRTRNGAVRITDFMPPRDENPDLVRIVEGIEGCVEMQMKLVVRFDYGLSVPWVRACDGGIYAVAGPEGLVLHCDVPLHGENLSTVSDFNISAGEKKSFVLTWYPSFQKVPSSVDPFKALDHTRKFWATWASHCTCRELEWSDDVMRSLMVLKGLTYHRTGGIVAAPTTSLPEQLGGVRNWDYRFCWIRDATFALYALMSNGYTEEAIAWRNWLLRAVAGSPEQLQILYGVAGERRLIEHELPHLPGYENSLPVRIGNAAIEQFQLDIYGEILDAIPLAHRVGVKPDKDAWALQRRLVEFVIGNWSRPDEGIWEVRGPRRHFTHSKMMAWVAMDRAVKEVEMFGLQGDAKRWAEVRDKIHREVCAEGFNKEIGAFTQSFGTDHLDASLLMMPLVGFLPAIDPRVKGTIEAIGKELMTDGFVHRYHPEKCAHVDGLPPGEGAFLPCSFWYADCLALLGRQDEAVELFKHLLSIRNDLGLISEEYDVGRKRLVGNFPQAFSHIGIINTARNLSESDGVAQERSK